MKKNKFTILFSLVILTLFGCSTDEKFSGSPVGNQTITTLTGSITANGPIINNEVFALPGQDIDFTANLPEGKTFTDTVTVEVTTLRSDGGRRRGYFDIMPGQSSVTGKVTAIGTLLYDGEFKLFMSAIKLQTVEPGIQYLMTSNEVSIKGGNSSYPDAESDRLNVYLTWENLSPANKVKLEIDKPVGSNDVTSNYGSGSGIKHIIRIEGPGTGTEGSSQSFREGTYTFRIKPDKQLQPIEDKKYRIIVVYPSGKVELFQGTLFGFSLSSSPVDVLRVTKTGYDGNAQFTAVQP